MNSQPAFTAPGKGAWVLDTAHYDRPVPPMHGAVLAQDFGRGFADGTRSHGLLLDHLAYRTVNGFVYFQPRGVGAPDGAGTPPPLVFGALARMVPAMRERVRRSGQALVLQPWREEARQWREVQRGRRAEATLALQRQPLAALTDDALARHVADCFANLRQALYWHGRLTIAAVYPVGHLMVQAAEWAQTTPQQVLQSLAGASPVSAGRLPERDVLGAQLAGDDAARELLETADPATALAQLRSLRPGLVPALDGWLEQVEHRLVSGYDVGNPTGVEIPQLLLEQLQDSIAHAEGRGAPVNTTAVTQLRDRVPAAHRAEFDTLLAEARHVSALRDERVLYNDSWASGVLRRAVLHAGQRLAARGRLQDAQHLIDADLPEITALLSGAPAPGADVLAARHAQRIAGTIADAPPTLGGEPGEVPSARWLPRGAQLGQQLTAAVVAAIFSDSSHVEGSDAHAVQGIGVSPGVAQGPARIVYSPADFARIRKGDILVACTTSPAYNTVLPLVSAIVTDRGGALSHAAIVTREYGIPGIVGCRNATQRLADGALVQVDGTQGMARPLAAH